MSRELKLCECCNKGIFNRMKSAKYCKSCARHLITLYLKINNLSISNEQLKKKISKYKHGTSKK